MFNEADLELIRWTVERFPALSRWELSQTICENLPWKAPNGQLRLHECLPLLEQLSAAGIIALPAKRARAPYRPARLRAEALPVTAMVASLDVVRPVTVDPVPPREQAVWDATMAQHHPLGFRRAFGAHQRYWIHGEAEGQRVVLGALLFAAAARHVAVRDAWLGWTREQQQRLRHRVVANSRLLILPGVCVPHLASHALALAVRRLPEDWRRRFGYEAVVAETFVAPPWRGTCYRAANWVHLGQSTGRGRQDRRYAAGGTVREVFVYPLLRNWRQALMADGAEGAAVGAPAPARRPEDIRGSRPGEGGSGVITAEQRLSAMSEERIRRRYEALAPFLNEKQRRLLAGAEALLYGAGGQERIAELVGVAKETVGRGLRELRHPESIEPERVRAPGGGRKRVVDTDPSLQRDLAELLEASTRGDPECALQWTTKSLRKLRDELRGREHRVSHTVVGELLHAMGYSLQAARKTEEGQEHGDERDAQFQQINESVKAFAAKGQPAISVDTKKKELVGNYKNGGREYHPKGQAPRVLMHDFVDEQLGKVNPYGIYDLARNEGFVNVGTDHDTPAFAVASIRSWWQRMGRQAYPGARELLITADCGGSNAARARAWKVELQRFAAESGLTVTVHHFPPGTSKWNKVEHRLFSEITKNWRNRSLINHETIMNLIGNTSTATGLTVKCQLDSNAYPTGSTISTKEMKAFREQHLREAKHRGQWNYTIYPGAAPREPMAEVQPRDGTSCPLASATGHE